MSIGKTGKRFDFQLSGRGFILARGQYKGRAWTRTGQADTPSRRSAEDARYGVLPDEYDHPEVWDDWSEGFGHAYRRNGEHTYHWGENFDARQPRQLVHCQLPQVVGDVFATMGGNYKQAGEAIDVLSEIPGGSAFAARPMILLGGNNGFMMAYPTATTFYRHSHSIGGNAAPALYPAAMFGSYLHFGNAGGTQYNAEGLNGAGWQIFLPAFRFATVGNRLWRAHGTAPENNRLLQNCANINQVATSLGWGATYNLGNQRETIQALIGYEDQIVAGTDYGLYVGDETGTFVNVMGEIAQGGHPDNCRDLTIHGGGVVAPHTAGVFRYRSNGLNAVVDNISPPTADRSPVQGRVRAVRGYGRNLYAGLYTGSQSWLLAGNESAGRMVWHTLQRFQHTAKFNRIYVDSIVTATGGEHIPNRMWAAMDGSYDTSGTAPCYFWPIPTLDGNPLAPAPSFSANYIGSARMDMGSVDFGAPSTRKVYRSVEIYADMLLSGYRYADVYYDLDQCGSFALLGRAQSAPKNTLYFSCGEGSFVTGQSIELSLRSFTASPAFTPIYRAVVLRGAMLPGSVETITAVTRIADNMRDRQGGTMKSAATQIEELRAMARANNPVVLTDISGATSYVNIIPPIDEQETYQSGEDDPEIAATIKMAVLVFSAPLTLEGSPGRRFIGPPVG